MALPKCSLEDREFQKFTECPGGETAVRVSICDDTTGGGGSGAAFFLDFDGDSNPGIAVSVFSFTVPVNTRRDLKKFNISSFTPGHYEIKLDGSLIGSGRISAGNLNHVFNFDPVRPIAAGESVTVEFTSLTGEPIQCFEAYLSGFDVSI